MKAKTFTEMGNEYFKREKLCVVVLSILALGGAVLYLHEGVYEKIRLHGLGWFALLTVLLVNVYSVRKYFIFSFYRRWIKNSLESLDALEKAQEEIRKLQHHVEQGTLRDIREIEEKGDFILDNHGLLDRYQADVVELGGKKYVHINRKDAWGKLDQWFLFHVYFGFFSFLVCLLHANFSFGGSFITRTLSSTLLLTLASGLVGMWAFRRSPSRLTNLEKEKSLENREFLEALLEKQMEKTAKDRSPSFKEGIHRFKKMLGQSKSMEEWRQERDEIKNKVQADEQDAFKKAMVFIAQWRQVREGLRPLRNYRMVQQLWLCVHIPISIAFVLFTFLHAFGALYF